MHSALYLQLYSTFSIKLGVLAWCSEFGEMIDTLKELGFHGNMFVTTRVQALKTCEEILRLKLDIQMQIILMYLSSQYLPPFQGPFFVIEGQQWCFAFLGGGG